MRLLQVLEHYRREGFQFVLRAFNEPMYLEDLTGLKQMQQDTMDAEVSSVICDKCDDLMELEQMQQDTRDAEVDTVIRDRISDVGTVISDNTSEVGAVISDKIGEVGTVISEVGTVISDKVSEVGTVITYKISEVGPLINYKISDVGTVISDEISDDLMGLECSRIPWMLRSAVICDALLEKPLINTTVAGMCCLEVKSVWSVTDWS